MIGTRKAKGPRQDDIITMRDGRYVIPMEESDFYQSRGIIHDRSRSGATVFVEPLVVVKMNNQLRELSLEEEAEIERILVEICDMIREELKDLDVTVRVLQELDFIHAKAQLSFDYDGNPPLLNEQGHIKLIEARHPLLQMSRGRNQVVPLSLALGQDYTTLIITGPKRGREDCGAEDRGSSHPDGCGWIAYTGKAPFGDLRFQKRMCRHRRRAVHRDGPIHLFLARFTYQRGLDRRRFAKPYSPGRAGRRNRPQGRSRSG